MQQQQGSSGHHLQEDGTLEVIVNLQEGADVTAPIHEESPLCGRRLGDNRPQEPAVVTTPRRQQDSPNSGGRPFCSMCCARRPSAWRRRAAGDRKLEDGPLDLPMVTGSQAPLVCDICMAEVHELAPFGEACAHTFCAECLARCLEHGIDRCPTCRAPRFLDEAELPSSASNSGEPSIPPLLDSQRGQLWFFVGRVGSRRWQLATLCSVVACAFVVYLAIVFLASGPRPDSQQEQEQQSFQRPLHHVVPALSRWLHSPGLHPVHIS